MSVKAEKFGTRGFTTTDETSGGTATGRDRKYQTRLAGKIYLYKI